MGRASQRKQHETPKARDEGWPCPGFELAPLVRIPPQVLGTVEERADTDQLVLALALAFNDFKDLEWMHGRLLRCQPPDEQLVSPEIGQWTGMRVHVARWELGIIHEILRVIGDAYHTQVLRQPAASEAVKRMTAAARDAWRSLVLAARGSPTIDPRLRPYLEATRNIAAFHYDGPELLRGYREAFRTVTNERNRYAYASMGVTFGRTRFYFADAAVQQIYAGPGELERLFELSGAFRNLIVVGASGFIRSYVARLAPSAPST